MGTVTRRESAQIHPFPPGGRDAGKRKPAAPAPVISTGRAWYHDVAIRDARGDKELGPRG